ncbi:MAG: queuosine precursor transporter [Sandaracinaceae bacterium]|nr:queuosine precursor transporter [Sandaracinaceae bacterium]
MFEINARQKLYIVLTCIFVTSLLTADIVAGKYFQIGGLSISVGVIPFPIAFLLTDIVNEYYGRKGARFLTAVGMAMIVFAFAIIMLARALPVSDISPVPQQAIDAVFGLSARLFGASLLAYLISQFVDIYSFHFAKKITNSRHLWLRALGSTVLSQVVDTVFVTFGSLLGTVPVGKILVITLWSYLYKVSVAAVLTPLCYLAHDIITDRLGIEPASVDEGVTE